MADPLSMSGSAVGIISLGIQVCNGLLVYADAIRGRSQDLSDHLDQVQPLLALFKSLELTITRLETLNPENAKILRDTMSQTEGKLESLQELLNEVGISPSATNGIKGKMKETFRVAIYPIKKSKLEGARQTVQALLSSLTATIQTVGLDLEISQNHILNEVHTTANVIKSNSVEMKAEVATGSDKLDGVETRLISVQQDFCDFSKQADGQLGSISADTKEGLENTRAILGLINDLSLQLKQTSLTNTSRTSQHNVTGRQVVATLGSRVPPSSLKQACDIYSTDFNLVTQFLCDKNPFSRRVRRQRHCRCRTQTMRRDKYLYGLRVYYERVNHHPDCPLAKYKAKNLKTQAGAQIKLQLSGIFSTLIDFSLCFTRGAGGASLSLPLKYRALLDQETNPVWQLLTEFGIELHNTHGLVSLPARLQTLRQQITRCFEQGRASPYDTSDTYFATYCEIFLRFAAEWVSYEVYDTEEASSLVLDIFSWLLDVGVSDTPRLHWTLWVTSNFAVRASPETASPFLGTFKDILSVIELDDDDLAVAFSQVPSSHYLQVASSFLPWIDMSPIMRAILLRSIDELNHQIKVAPDSVLETVNGLTTLQLCREWPQGLESLIESRARYLTHERNTFGQNFLHSIFHDHISHITDYVNPGVLELLLQHGFSLFPDNNFEVLNLYLSTEQAQITQLVAQHMADRLLRLSEMALGLGVLEKGQEFHLQPGKGTKIPDFTTAASWCATIQDMGESVDPFLLVPISKDLIASVYHSRSMSLRNFKTFDAYGFDHQTVRDEIGLPPIFISRPAAYELYPNPVDTRTRLDIEQTLPWLTIHGFMAPTPDDLLNLGLNVHATGTHFIAAQTGAHLRIEVSGTPNGQLNYSRCFQSAEDLFRFLATASDRDECICWCHAKGKGCSPLQILYKSHARDDHAHNDHKRYNGMEIWRSGCWERPSLNDLLLGFEIFENHEGTKIREERGLHSLNKQLSTRALELLRLLTFEALEMRHTCCMYESVDTRGIALQHDCGNPNIGRNLEVILSCDPAVAKVVRSDDHEKASAEFLGSLMADFTTEMEQNYSRGTFSEFIFGYWQSRIQELYSAQHGEVEKMEQILDNVQIGIWTQPVRRLLWPRDPWESSDSFMSSEDENAKETDGYEDSDSDSQ
ncbi:hypothetical protein FGRMN_3207 [Fusarium graminum]|nr:hypothetical protein FGRMN_3207 [Fusarium graminum]